MYRIHFTAQDLARVRVVPGGPLMETEAAFWLLQRPDRAVYFDGWRRLSRTRLAPVRRQLGAVIPGELRPSLDVFTLSGGPADSVDHSLEVLRSCPASHIEKEARYADQRLLLRSWARGLTTAEPAARDLLDCGLRAVYRAAVESHWNQIRTHYAAERATYARALTEGGVDQLFMLLRPWIRWQQPVLTIPTGRSPGRDYHLNGRGLTLSPSFFILKPLVSPNAFDETAPLVLSVPPLDVNAAALRLRLTNDSGGANNRLVALIGRTRAAALETIASGCTTSDLAKCLGISPASASEHATVLRVAGLVTSRRHRNTVFHSLTPLGISLLNGT